MESDIEIDKKGVTSQTNSYLGTVVFLPILGVLPIILAIIVSLLSIVIVPVVATGASSEDATSIDKVENNTQQDEGAQQGQAGSCAWCVKVQEPGLRLVDHGARIFKELVGEGSGHKAKEYTN